MKISKFQFTIKPQKELFLPPYKGSTFRGGFGHAFKRAVCMERNEDCIQCSARHDCVYSYVFNTSILQEVEKGERFPHPFIIEPPLEDKEYYRVIESFELVIEAAQLNYHQVAFNFIKPTRIKWGVLWVE